MSAVEAIDQRTGEPMFTEAKHAAAAAAWLAALQRHDRAQREFMAAQQELHVANLGLKEQEAAGGLPAWEHLQRTSERAHCRVRDCNAHRYARPVVPTMPDDEEPF